MRWHDTPQVIARVNWMIEARGIQYTKLIPHYLSVSLGRFFLTFPANQSQCATEYKKEILRPQVVWTGGYIPNGLEGA
jgi:hypothetical protein